MPTTTNNGWPTPADTDLVKNGADAIRDLGNAIDTTLGVYSPATPGLVKINTTSFSGVTSQSFNDVFSATYKSYMIVISNLTCATNDNLLNMRLRVSGADNSSSNYENGRLFVGAYSLTTFGSANSDLLSFWNIGRMNNTIQQGGTIFIHNPFLTANTIKTNLWAGYSFEASGGVTTVTTSYTGFTLLPNDGGNIAATVTIYGLAE
jgi:hypothetical protein